jgi:hypothetical protein
MAMTDDEARAAATDSAWYDICQPSGTSDTTGWRTVGASMYGGKLTGSTWGPDNDKQGGGHDDTGVNDYDNGALGTGAPVGTKPDAPASFAELDNGKALGGLDDHTKVEIKYKNKMIVAERNDNGGGGGDVKGAHRAVDLWWETAKLLGFDAGLDTVQVRVATDQNVAATPLNGKPADAAANSDTGGGGCCSNTSAAGNEALTGGDNVEKVFNYFTSAPRSLTPTQTAGIIGNLQQESGPNINPKAVQAGGPGRGIAQWSAGDRWDALQKHEKGKDPLSLATQLDYIWYEMNNVSPWKLSLKGSTSSEYPSLTDIKGSTRKDAIKAAHSFGYLYERFGVSGARDELAGKIWDKYHNHAPGSGSGGTCEGASGICAGAPAGYVQNVNKVVDIACQEWNKKVIEDAGENCDKAGNIKKYIGGHCGGLENAWCGYFVGWVYKQAGHPFPASSGYPGVASLYSYLGNVGARRSPSTTPKPGDVVTYGQHHTGLVVGVNPPNEPKNTVVTIEGNTGGDPKTDKWVGTKSNYDGIHMHVRHFPGSGQSAWGDYDVLISKQK